MIWTSKMGYFRFPEPCLCGDPECYRCFPRVRRVRMDDDREYDRQKEEKDEDSN